MYLMCFFNSTFYRVFHPKTALWVRMSTAARLTIRFTCANSSFSLIEWLLNCLSTQKLHIKVPHKNKASIILNKRVLLNWYHYWNSSLTEYFSYLFWLASRYENYLYLVAFLIKQILNPGFVKFLFYSSTIFFKKQTEFFCLGIKIPVARNVDNLGVL